jgi:hypothetical protein
VVPDDFASQKNCLKGLVYGLAQKDAAIASTVFQTLSPADQASSAEEVARSLFLNHGPAAVDLVTSKVHGDVKYKCLQGILDRMEKRPSTETVPWLAAQLTSSPEAAPALVKAWKRWTTGDPAAAAAWRSSAVSANPQLEQILADEKP